jgi:large subunit ribosomal protein L21
MYAVVSSGGKQYKVQEGEILRVEKIPGDVGSAITFDQVLMVAEGDKVNIGQPVLDDALVEGHIVEQGKGKKIIVFKYKRRKRYRRTQGHRQQFTAIKIDSIKAKTAKAPKKAEPKAEAKKEVKKAAPKKVETQKAEAKVEAKQPAVKKKEVKQPAAKPEAKKTAAPKAKEAEAKPKAKKEAAPKTEAKKAAVKKTAARKTTAKKTETKKTTAKPKKKAPSD